MTLTGTAVSGGSDSVVFGIGGDLYTATGPDSFLDLAPNWKNVEFNIFGDGCDSEAEFNSGASVIPEVAVDYGYSAPPTCVNTGYTGETNNLDFASPPDISTIGSPALAWSENTTGGAKSACHSVIEIGEPTLTFSPSSVNFGDKTAVGKVKEESVTIKNTSSKNSKLDVTITGETTAAPFAVKSQCEKPLKPGQSCKVKVTFTPPNTTPQSGELTVNDDGARAPQMVPLSGTGK